MCTIAWHNSTSILYCFLFCVFCLFTPNTLASNLLPHLAAISSFAYQLSFCHLIFTPLSEPILNTNSSHFSILFIIVFTTLRLSYSHRVLENFVFDADQNSHQELHVWTINFLTILRCQVIRSALYLVLSTLVSASHIIVGFPRVL